MLKEVTKDEALQAAVEGRPSMVVYDVGSDDSVLTTFSITERLKELTGYEGARFLVDEPEPEEKPEPEKTEEKKPETKKPETKKKKRKPDKGKLRALYRAGWSPMAIALEMKLPLEDVDMYIEEIREGTENDEGKGNRDTEEAV